VENSKRIGVQCVLDENCVVDKTWLVGVEGRQNDAGI